jgi:Flp pilus assembly protein TadG
MKRLRASVVAFAKDETGLLLAEFLILLPMMIWGFLALFIYWEVFRTINTTQKAAYSIADLLSRQEVVTTDFIDGLQEVQDFLAPDVRGSRMRITSFEYDEGEDKYVLLFSRSPGNKVPVYNNASLQAIKPRVPDMVDRDSVILVETWSDYVPFVNPGLLNFAPGLGGQVFEQFIVTFPRKRRVCLDGTSTCT